MHNPENYDKVKLSHGSRNLAADILLPPLLSKMKTKGKNQIILDFGCGTGLFAQTYLFPLAEETDSKIWGLDISEEMIRYASDNYSHERIKFVCGNIMDDSFQLGERNFDIIISFFVLHFIKDYKEALKRLYGLLKPGGQCGLIVSAEHNQFPSYKLLGEDPKWSDYMKGYEEFCPDWTYSENSAEAAKTSVGKAAEEVGFKIIELSLKDMGFTCESLNVHTEFLLTLNPFIMNIPKEKHTEIHSSLLTHICKLWGFPDTKEFHASPFTDEHFHALAVVLEKPLNL